MRTRDQYRGMCVFRIALEKGVETRVNVCIKRIYDSPTPEDGTRILVDRLWPRGVSREAAKLDLWMKEVAPSPELRKFFHHQEERFDEFAALYRQALAVDAEARSAVEKIRSLAEETKVTLLYAAKSRAVNHAVVLADVIRSS